MLSSKDGDRFGRHPWRATPAGAILIEQAALWLTCRLHSTFDGGDHEIALYEIADISVFDGVEPLVFHQSRYRTIAAADER
jgi:flavin reductase (DIM6/NTAB) family NADH-FMN oxidoreductase RutF